MRFLYVHVSLFLVCLTLTGCFGGGSSVSNPAPILSSIAPTSALVTVPPLTAAATNITITGSGFMASSKISWNGDALTTNYVNSTSLTAQVPLAYLMTAGIASISVVNPSPGGCTSASVAFTVADPVPSLTEINPVSAASGSDVYIDVLGGNFVQSSVVEWNGVPLQTFFSGSMAISARVPAAYLTDSGSCNDYGVQPRSRRRQHQRGYIRYIYFRPSNRAESG